MRHRLPRDKGKLKFATYDKDTIFQRESTMGLDRLIIQLRPTPSGLHYPGQLVSGSVFVTSTENETIYGFYLKANGSANVCWSNNARGEGNFKIEATENYLDLTVPLVSSRGDRMELAAGKHEYPFSFTLPSAIPSSYEGIHGNIRYTMKAIIKRPWYKADHVSDEIPFTVSVNVGLNRNPNEMVAPSFGTPSLSSNSLQVVAWLNRSGYIPGETIYFNSKIENRSGQSVLQTLIQLVQYTTFSDRKRSSQTKSILWERREGKISDKNTKVWDNFPIVVPYVPPTGMPYCNLIDITYAIEMIIDPGLRSAPMIVRLELQVASVPPLSYPFLKPEEPRQQIPFDSVKMSSGFGSSTSPLPSAPPELLFDN